MGDEAIANTSLAKENDFSATAVDLFKYFIGYSNGILNTFGLKLPYESRPKKLSEIHGMIGPGLEFNVQQIEKNMQPSMLDVDGEIPTFKIDIQGAAQPKVFQRPMQEDIDSLKSLKWANSHVKEKYYTIQYHEKLWIKSNPQSKQTDLDLNPFGDYIIHIRVHKPFKNEPKVKKSLKLSTQEDVLVLSSQNLSVLKDVICCPNDFSTCGDKTDEPSRIDMLYAKNLFPSGFFFIENTFYNDTRKTTNLDYSKVIREWAAMNPNFPPTDFKVDSMENVTFRELKLKMGYPYLYKHLGACEHIITFLNAKLLNRPDNLNSKYYPMRKIPFGQATQKLCIMCGYFNATWVTVGNEFVPHDPAFFCEHCFHSYNFVDGKRICNFTSYPLIDGKNFPKNLEPKITPAPRPENKGQAHPLLFTPRNLHRELLVNTESVYPTADEQ
ncbi:uncharacterized protein LOC132203792 [Neocloeon triangulifer]|uniref:uncharacterized protein LOC132203792 n=1 Tax=Neocloeon triangulifer TaxID=2078957 RepID=UPI00286F5012|nr:uncharacterized protein LOC132203792 [Neocloeon triangulifer]